MIGSVEARYDEYYSSQNYTTTSSPRGVAMILAFVTAVVLSPLYASDYRMNINGTDYETKWRSGLVLPMVLAALIVAIKTTTSTNNNSSNNTSSSSSSSSWMVRIGSSSWGLAGVLVILLFLISAQHSVQHLFWRS